MPGILASVSGRRSRDRAITREVTITAAIAEEREKEKVGRGDLCPDSLSLSLPSVKKRWEGERLLIEIVGGERNDE